MPAVSHRRPGSSRGRRSTNRRDPSPAWGTSHGARPADGRRLRLTFARTYANAGRQARLGFDGTRVVGPADSQPVARGGRAGASPRVPRVSNDLTASRRDSGYRRRRAVGRTSRSRLVRPRRRPLVASRASGLDARPGLRRRAARARSCVDGFARHALRTERLVGDASAASCSREPPLVPSPGAYYRGTSVPSEALDTLLEQEDRLHRGADGRQAWRAGNSLGT